MKYYSSLILFLLLFNPGFSQDTSKTMNKELKHGIQFQIGSLLNLTNFSGYTFSYRYCFDNCSGLRFGIYTSVYDEDLDIRQQVDSITNNPPYFNRNYNFKLSVQYLHAITNFENFALIFGGGPFVSYSNRDSYQEGLGSSYLTKYTDKDKTISYGLDIILGVEYRLFTNVILSGEYGLTFSTESSKIETEMTQIGDSINRTSKQKGDRDRFIIRGTGVNLGISIFF